MNFTETNNLSKEQKYQTFGIWNEEYPKELLYSNLAEFEQYLQSITDRHHIILSDEYGVVKGWFIYFIRNDERCFAMILDSSIQGKG